MGSYARKLPVQMVLEEVVKGDVGEMFRPGVVQSADDFRRPSGVRTPLCEVAGTHFVPEEGEGGVRLKPGGVFLDEGLGLAVCKKRRGHEAEYLLQELPFYPHYFRVIDVGYVMEARFFLADLAAKGAADGEKVVQV